MQEGRAIIQNDPNQVEKVEETSARSTEVKSIEDGITPTAGARVRNRLGCCGRCQDGTRAPGCPREIPT